MLFCAADLTYHSSLSGGKNIQKEKEFLPTVTLFSSGTEFPQKSPVDPPSVSLAKWGQESTLG